MLKELRTNHRTIIQMKFSGFTNSEIAEKTGMSQSTVSQIIRSPLGEAYLNGLQDRAKEDILDVRKKLVSLNKDALKTFERLIDPKTKAPHSVQYNTAKDILDRNGYKAPDKYVIDMTLSTKTDEEIEAEINALEASINRTKKIGPTEVGNAVKEQITSTVNLFLEDASSKDSDIIETFDDSESFDESDFFESSDEETLDEESELLIDSLPKDLLSSTNK